MGRRAKYLTQKAKNKSKYKFEIKKKQLEEKIKWEKIINKRRANQIIEFYNKKIIKLGEVNDMLKMKMKNYLNYNDSISKESYYINIINELKNEIKNLKKLNALYLNIIKSFNNI